MKRPDTGRTMPCVVTFASVVLFCGLVWTGSASAAEPAAANSAQPEGATPLLLQELKTYPHRLLFETYREGNWEIYTMNADGSNPVNLTRTPDADEFYPKASPDGTKICFVVDEGKGAAKARNLYLMDLDGTQRTKIMDNAREPCWSADSQSIAYLKGEFNKWDAMDYVTKGLFIYDLKTGAHRPHPNSKIHHLYCLNWSPDGKWFVATVHGGMGFDHAILALEADGEKVFNLGLGGCRPDVSPDGKKVIWGNGDFSIGMASLEFSPGSAKATFLDNAVESKKPDETYHADWSPDGKYIAFTRGAKRKDRKMGLAPEIPGSDAPGWNICVADPTTKNRWVSITLDGNSNKEPDWVFVKNDSGK
jgi:Tol biopolymer transport system component